MGFEHSKFVGLIFLVILSPVFAVDLFMISRNGKTIHFLLFSAYFHSHVISLSFVFCFLLLFGGVHKGLKTFYFNASNFIVLYFSLKSALERLLFTLLYFWLRLFFPIFMKNHCFRIFHVVMGFKSHFQPIHIILNGVFV